GGQHGETPSNASGSPPPSDANSTQSTTSVSNGHLAMSGGPAGQKLNNADLLEIRAPMLGTFYRSPKPGAEPFVTVGSRVQSDTVIGIIEVMKLMNSAAAGVSGEVVEILAQDGELVEYDQPLMRDRKSTRLNS